MGLANSFVSVGIMRQLNEYTNNWLITAESSGNIYAGQQAIIGGFNSRLSQGNFSAYTIDQHSAITTVSTQAVISPVKSLTLLLGESYSKPDVHLNTDGQASVFDFKGQFSARVGATYEFLPGVNAYISYSESFLPQENETYNNGVIGILPPLTGHEYEAGVKYLTNNGKLLLTAAAYEVHEKNIAAYQQTVAAIDYYQPIGEDTHKGIELSALGRIGSSWQINAGYSYLRPTITSASASETATVGQTELYTPVQTASIYVSHEFLGGLTRGLSLGGGTHYVSTEQTSFRSALANEEFSGTPGVPVPSTRDIAGYFVADASASYSFDKWLMQLNGRNLFNRL